MYQECTGKSAKIQVPYPLNLGILRVLAPYLGIRIRRIFFLFMGKFPYLRLCKAAIVRQYQRRPMGLVRDGQRRERGWSHLPELFSTASVYFSEEKFQRRSNCYEDKDRKS